VLVIGETNIPWGLDPAVRRRFERRVYISLPTVEARIYLLKNVMMKIDNDLLQKDYEILGEKTEGFSGADLSILARDACYESLRKAKTS